MLSDYNLSLLTLTTNYFQSSKFDVSLPPKVAIMSKYVLIVLLVFGLFGTASAQEVLEKIAQDACDCLSGKDLSGKEQQEIQMEMSRCLMQKVGNYQSELQDQLDVDVTNQQAMQELGQQIGMKMVNKCPDLMMQMAQVQGGGQKDLDTEKMYQVEGVVAGIEGDEFTYVVVKDDSGRNQKFLWFRYFEGSDPFVQDPQTMVGKKVQLTFSPVECYSPKLNEYFKRNEIRALKIVE